MPWPTRPAAPSWRVSREGTLTVAELDRPVRGFAAGHLEAPQGAGGGGPDLASADGGTARLSHLEAEPLREATAWLARYREYWDESYERLDELLRRLQDCTDQAHEGSQP